jgi:hypothetical protein
VLDSAYDAFYENRHASINDVVKNIGRSRPLVLSLGSQMSRILTMLDNGRIEVASDEMIPIQSLVERLQIHIL